jgi:hypothetical protein
VLVMSYSKLAVLGKVVLVWWLLLLTDMHVWNGLPCLGPVLEGQVEGSQFGLCFACWASSWPW